MKKNIFLLALIFFILGAIRAQYVTPNTGMKYSFNELVTNSSGAVVKEGVFFVIKNDVTISPLDSLVVTEDISVKIFADKILTINGAYWEVTPPTQATFTHYATGEYYATIRVEEGSFVRLNKTTFTYGSGIRVINADFEMDDCTMNYHNYSSQASGAISTTTGKVTVNNSTFKNNVRSAFNSGANTQCTFEITNCYLENNVTENSNRPQINIGPCKTGEVSKIVNNTIIGNRESTMVGGISTSSLLGVFTASFIEGNLVKDNRYGITLTGSNINSTIKGNILQDNNTQNSPNLGGSGINITASSGNVHAIITGNIISGNLWGITLVGNTSTFATGPTANIGNISVPENDPEYNIGKNIFFNNGNEGELYDLYNNNPNDIMAQNNNWGVPEQTEELIRTVIRDKFNNPNYGTVTYMPPYILPEVCDPITNLSVSYTVGCKAELTWEASGENPFNIYRDGDLIAEKEMATYFTDEDFDQTLPHTWAVTVVCPEPAGESEPVEKILSYCSGCPSVTGASVVVTCVSAHISWTSVSGAIGYKVLSGGELLAIVAATEIMLTGLFEDGVSYTWEIVTVCGGADSSPVCATGIAHCEGIRNTETNTFTILPNPAQSGDITIKAGADFNTVEVLNLLGQTVISQQVFGTEVKLDVSYLNNGIYFVRITSEKGDCVKKFVKKER